MSERAHSEPLAGAAADRPSAPQRPTALQFLALVCLPLLWIGPSLLPGRLFLPQLPVSFEPLASEYPARAERAKQAANLVASDAIFPLLSDELAIQEQLGQDRLPLWTPLLGRGAPLSAGSMAAPWNPLRWPLLWMEAAQARAWHALLALFLAGAGMLLFLQQRVRPGPALLGALVLQAGGFGFANLHYLPKFDAALWLPWCLWAAEGVLGGRRRGAGLLLAGALAASGLAGFAPIFAFVVATTAAWSFHLRSSAAPGALTRTAAYAGLGLLMAAVHILPMASAASQSTRGAMTRAQVADGALAPAALAGWLGAEVFGSPTDAEPANRHAVAWWLSRTGKSAEILAANRLEWSIYLGTTALILALAALAVPWRQLGFPLVALAVCLAFQWGVPGVSWLYGLPGFDLGSPARAGAIAWVLWPWLAALGLTALLDGRRAAQWIAGSTGLFLVVGAAWLGLRNMDNAWLADWRMALAQRHAISPEELKRYISTQHAAANFAALQQSAWAVAAMALATLVLLWRARRLGSWLVTAGLALLVVVGGIQAGWNWTRPRSLAPGEELFPPSRTLDIIAETAGAGRVLRVDTSPSGIDEVLALARPNLLQVYGIADLAPYCALPDGDLVRALAALDPAGRYRSGWSALSDPALLDAPLLDELAVTCVLARLPLAHPRLALVHEENGLYIFSRSLILAEGAPRNLTAAGLAREKDARRVFGMGALLSLAALLGALLLAYFSRSAEKRSSDPTSRAPASSL